MKKLSVCFLILFLCLCCFAACDQSQKPEESEVETSGCEHEHTGEMIPSEYTHFYQYTCGCPSNEIAEMHLDSDGDGRCDICEYNMSEHEHIYENHHDENGHGWSYTCGCLTPPNFALHSDGDNDGECDVCGYDGMGIVLPENALLVEFESWISQLNAENVTEIKTTFEYVGVAPGSLKDISRTVDKSVIADVIEKYRQLPMMSVPAEDTYILGGSAFSIEFILSDGTVKKLFFNNGHYIYGFNQETLSALCYFRLDAPTLEGYDNVEKSNGFITYREPCYVWRKDGSCEPCRVCKIDVGAFEFIEIEAPTDPTRSDLLVDTDFGTLTFVDNSVFYILEYGNKYYRLVGKNLDEMIEDASKKEYKLTMNDPEWLYEDLKPTYRVGETVSVKIRMAYDLGYIFLVNGARVYDDRYVSGEYWEFTFTMPERDTEIDFLTYDGFLPDKNYSVLIEAYLIKHQDAEYVYIDKYYGETSRGALVAMIVAGDYSDEEWQEKIGNVTIEYYNGNRITVYYRGKFYTLTEAYSEGCITFEELQKIAEQHASAE